MSDLGKKAAEIAISESKRTDTSERIDNRGPRIDKYLAHANHLPEDSNKAGEAWCGIFVYWCYSQAAKELNIPNPLPRTTFSGTELKNWAEANKNWVIYRAGQEEVTLEPGDIFVPISHSHVGMVIAPLKLVTKNSQTHNFFTSIEGNQMSSDHPEWGNKGIRQKMVDIAKCAVIIRVPV
jgi:hypothetical protein